MMKYNSAVGNRILAKFWCENRILSRILILTWEYVCMMKYHSGEKIEFYQNSAWKIEFVAEF